MNARYERSKIEPDCFGERGPGILDPLRDPELSFLGGPEVIYSHSMTGSPGTWIRSLCKNHPDQVWLRVFEFAKDRKKLNFDEIVKAAALERLNYLGIIDATRGTIELSRV